MPGSHFFQVLLDAPFDGPLDYANPEPSDAPAHASIGLRCVVPLGRRKAIGIVVGAADRSELEPSRIRPVVRVLDDIAPLSAHWLALTRFASEYYQHPWGEVALPALPPALRQLPGPRYSSALARLRARPVSTDAPTPGSARVALTAEQAACSRSSTALQEMLLKNASIYCFRSCG